MHFPWKKVKSTTISQFVNDHLHHSQKRRDGSSLVVETGFPTSLIDLFIKNREKWKKPSKKKPPSEPITPQIDANGPVIVESRSAGSSPLPSPSPVISSASPPLYCPTPLQIPSHVPLPCRGVSEIRVVESGDGVASVGVDKRRGDVKRGVDANNVLMVVLKVFLVVVLGLGANRLTVGITISAFLLFFIESAGKYACILWKQCSDLNGMLWSVAQSVWRLLRFKEVNLDDTKGGVVMPALQQEQEVQTVDPNCESVNRPEEIQPVNEITVSPPVKVGLGSQEINSKETLVMEKDEPLTKEAEPKRKSKSARIKSKIKKFVPKKIRKLRKHHDDPRRLEIVREDVALLCEDEHEVYEYEDEGESQSARSSLSSGNYTEDDGKRVSCAVSRLSDVSEEPITEIEGKGQEVETEEKCQESEGCELNWKHLVLGLIVLIGLTQGRLFAFVLTLSWCCLLTLGETLCMKVPIIRSSIDKSS